ncbi:MAG: phosphatidate cytidylyltransferase [Geminicoccaceae bacterium]
MALPQASLHDPALRQRIASSIVLAAIAVSASVVGGWPFVLLVLAAVAVMAVEWAKLATSAEGWRQLAATLAVAPLAAVIALALGYSGAAPVVLVLGSVAAALAAWLRHWCEPLRAAGGVLYVGVPALALVWLRGSSAGLQHLLWLLIVIAATDTCAYLVGRTLGGPRLAPRISPGKTWSGLLGGVAGAGLLGAVASHALGAGVMFAAAVGAGLAVVGQLGDLFESALKRRAGVKDSGRLIPGHGGLLDRIDGLVFAAPAFAAFVWSGLLLAAPS